MKGFVSAASTVTDAEHDAGGAANTVGVTYFSASTTLSPGLSEPPCTSTSVTGANP